MDKQDYKFHYTQPNNIVFMIDYGTTEVLRITKEGVWANPDFTADETAKKVLEILDVHVKVMVNAAVEQERKEFAVHAIDIARKAIEERDKFWQNHMEPQIEIEVNEAILEEREACAKLCDDLDDDVPDGLAGWQYGEAIRARGEMK
jgi:hypothetical protein